MVKWSAFLLREAGGKAIGAGWITSDLTQRLEVEGRLRESRARLKAEISKLTGVRARTRRTAQRGPSFGEARCPKASKAPPARPTTPRRP
jgi:hypothetical protein